MASLSASTIPLGQIAQPVAVSAPNQFVTFNSGERAFGVDIMAVREIRSWSPTTELPGQPAEACGVLDIRGSIVQVYDLRALIGGRDSGRAGGAGQVVLVVSLRDQEVGILVDTVSDIIFADRDDMRPAPAPMGPHGTSIVSGLVKNESRLIAILDLEALFPEGGSGQVTFI